MLSHYIRIALRSIGRQKLHASLAIASLGLGLACFIASYVAVAYLNSAESQFANAPRIFAVYQATRSANGGESPLLPISAAALAPQLAADFPQLAAVARAAPGGSFVAAGDKRLAQNVRAVDREFLEIFDLPFTAGDPANALQHGTAIGTTSAARALFGTHDVVGRTIQIGGSVELTITGVIEDLEAPTHLGNSFFGGRMGWFVPMHVYEELYPLMARNPPWSNGGGIYTYVLLPANGSFTARELNAGLATFGARHVPSDFGTVQFAARHVSRIATDFYQSIRLQRTVGVLSVQTMLLGLGTLALAAAVLNFVNLATAQAARRAREIGVRKALGATPARIARQHLAETFTTTAAAFVLGVVVVGAAAWFWLERFSSINLAALPIGTLVVFSIVLLGGVTLLAGAYPALILARTRTIDALATGALRGGSRLLRSVLVGTQFAVAGLLLLAVLVMYNQGNELADRALPPTDDAFLTISAGFGPAGASYEAFAAEIKRSPHVVGVTTTGMPPWSVALGARSTPAARSQDAAVETVAVHWRTVGHDYFETLSMELLAGRLFARDRPDDALAPSSGPEAPRTRMAPPRAVLDRTAAARLGWSDPRDAVGELIYSGVNRERTHEIIGIVESLPLTLSGEAEGSIYQLFPSVTNGVIVRLAHDSVAQGVADIEAAWTQLAPGAPLNRTFLDDGFRNAYGMYAAVNRLFVGLAAFVLFIASAGSFGIASYSVRARLREIGVRKIFGASPARILQLMLWDFGKPVVIANVLVWPIGVISMQAYLAMFAQRMPLTPLPFVLALGIALAIAWIAAGAHIAAATRVEPARVLRRE